MRRTQRVSSQRTHSRSEETSVTQMETRDGLGQSSAVTQRKRPPSVRVMSTGVEPQFSRLLHPRSPAATTATAVTKARCTARVLANFRPPVTNRAPACPPVLKHASPGKRVLALRAPC